MWVLGIARHVATDQLRTQGRELRRRASPGEAAGEEGSVLERLLDPDPGAEEQMASEEQRARVRRAVDGLADNPRQAILLFHVEGLGYQQISERLGVPLGTVATWVTRSRKALAEALEEERTP